MAMPFICQMTLLNANDDFTTCQFVSIKGRLTKKCVFIKTYDLAV